MNEEEFEKALRFFKKIIKHELNISIDIEESQETEETLSGTSIDQPTTLEPLQPEPHSAFQEPISETQMQTSVMEPQLPTSQEPIHEPRSQEQHISEHKLPMAEAPSETELFKELSMEALSPDIVDISQAFMNEIRSLKETLIERIRSLEERIEKIEKIIPKLLEISKGRPSAPPSTQAIEHKFYTDETEIWLKDAQDVLRVDEISLERLIKLEALEWNLLKAYEAGALSSDKASEILQKLRMEINRLRHMLLK